jgi:hypothetical protein
VGFFLPYANITNLTDQRLPVVVSACFTLEAHIFSYSGDTMHSPASSGQKALAFSVGGLNIAAL